MSENDMDEQLSAADEMTAILVSLRDQLLAKNAEIERLKVICQSKHDYGPASPGEQEAGWLQYCRRSGWDANGHPSAKNAYVEGYCDGDAFSQGDEAVGLLRKELILAKETIGAGLEQELAMHHQLADAKAEVERLRADKEKSNG